VRDKNGQALAYVYFEDKRPFRKSLSGVQLIEQSLGLHQDRRIEAFGEPVIDRLACSADRNPFGTSDRLVKSGPPAICGHGQGFAAFVRPIRRGVANGQRCAFHNSNLCAGKIDCLVKSALTGATWLPVG
jgi:hypothetical protein